MAGRLFTIVVAALALSAASSAPLRAQQADDQPSTPAHPAPLRQMALAAPAALSQIVTSEIKVLRSGPLLIHGNYCGIGNRPGSTPVDPLDTACMHHDTCTKTGTLPSCDCDDRLRAEATAVARDAETPPDVQAVALATAASMTVLICR